MAKKNGAKRIENAVEAATAIEEALGLIKAVQACNLRGMVHIGAGSRQRLAEARIALSLVTVES